MEWEVSWWVLRSDGGFAQVHDNASHPNKWAASAYLWRDSRTTDLGTYATADEAKAACVSWLTTGTAGVWATCGAVNVDGDGRAVSL